MTDLKDRAMANEHVARFMESDLVAAVADHNVFVILIVILVVLSLAGFVLRVARAAATAALVVAGVMFVTSLLAG
jgi:hypothetical protein